MFSTLKRVHITVPIEILNRRLVALRITSKGFIMTYEGFGRALATPSTPSCSPTLLAFWAAASHLPGPGHSVLYHRREPLHLRHAVLSPRDPFRPPLTPSPSTATAAGSAGARGFSL